nr:MAG TPA: Dynein heavy chain region D6 P-loop domain [Caudoviricetes sp.]
MKEPDFRLWCRSEKRMGKVIEIRHVFTHDFI